MPIRSVPPVSDRAEALALTLVRRYNREARGLRDALHGVYDPFLSDYLQNLHHVFYEAMALHGTEQVWDFFKAAEQGVIIDLAESFREMTAAAEEAAGDVLTDELSDGVGEGYLLGLWTLRELGLDEDLILAEAQDVPDVADASNLLTILGIGAVGYLSRLNDWTSHYTSKAERWLRASVLGEFPLDRTIEPVEYIGKTLTNRIVAMGEDELYRAYTIGQKVAWQNFSGFVAGSIWLTREDERVCPICREKDFKITWEEPIKDSHPNCRCMKVPILVNAAGDLVDPSGNPIEYSQFRTRFLRRRS